MLGSEVLAVRLGGIYDLERLAREYPCEYHLQIMRLFCAFVCHPLKQSTEIVTAINKGKADQSGEFELEIKPPPRADIRTVLEAIGTRSEAQIELEDQAHYAPNLYGADLRNQNLSGLNLSGIQLVRAKLCGAFLAKTIFSGAKFFEADLSGAKLPGANFSDASLVGANLSSVTECYATDFSNTYLSSANLTNADLSGAIFNGTILQGANLAGAIFYKDGTLAEGLTQRQINFGGCQTRRQSTTFRWIDRS